MAYEAITIKDGAGVNKTIMAIGDGTNYAFAHTTDSNIATYRASVSAFAMVATPTVAFIIFGSASATVRVRKLRLAGAATAAANMPYTLYRGSTTGTIGSAVLGNITSSKADSSNGAASAVCSTVGTANYTTVPTTAGLIGASRLQMPALTTGLGVSADLWQFGTGGEQSVVLRGTSECFAVNFNGTAIPAGGVVDFAIEWTESATG